jgi:hypothetical protein
LFHSLRILTRAYIFRRFEPPAIDVSPISSITVAPPVRQTNAGAKLAAQKRLSASTYEPWLEQPNYPPGALTYIKGNRRIDVDLRMFLVATPGKRAIHWFPEPDAGR